MKTVKRTSQRGHFMPESITLPVHVKTTAVYDTIIDSEDRLIAFVAICEKSRDRADAIAASLNKMVAQ